jgi:hypothetical protein
VAAPERVGSIGLTVTGTSAAAASITNNPPEFEFLSVPYLLRSHDMSHSPAETWTSQDKPSDAQSTVRHARRPGNNPAMTTSLRDWTVRFPAIHVKRSG